MGLKLENRARKLRRKGGQYGIEQAPGPGTAAGAPAAHSLAGGPAAPPALAAGSAGVFLQLGGLWANSWPLRLLAGLQVAMARGLDRPGRSGALLFATAIVHEIHLA
jgi:hypothetical protein